MKQMILLKDLLILSALSSNNLEKYEYLTGEDLGLKPSTIEQTKFECSPLGKIINKGLSKDDQKEDKNEIQLKAIEDKKQLDTNSLKSVSYFSQLSPKAKELLEKITKERNDPEKFVCVKTIFNFNKFKTFLDLGSNIYKNKKLLKGEQNKQSEIKILLNKLRKYNPTKLKKINAKVQTLSAAEKLLNNRQEVIDAFKAGIFPYIDGFQIKEEVKSDGFKKSIEYIENESEGINCDLFKDYFNFIVPSALVKKLKKCR